MKILYDHQIFSSQKYGGISRYFYELINNFIKKGEIVKISLKYSNNSYVNKISNFKITRFFKNFDFKGKRRVIHFINKIFSIQEMKKGDFDIFHPTYYDTYFLDYIGNKPYVLTIYDMTHEIFPEEFQPNDSTVVSKRLLAEKAVKIIAISENTKKDIMRIYGFSDKKVEVVYLANSLNNKNISPGMKLPKKYFLYVGGRYFYKNFKNFTLATFELIKKDRNLKIICVGGDKFTSAEINFFDKIGIKDSICHYPVVNDELLSCLYSNALAFVFPSLYEGFGIPILESFSCGCPVILSDTSSFPEVAGDAGIYFNPNDIDSIIIALNTVYDDKKRESLINKGYERLKKFSWSKTAEETKRVYESILSEF